MFDEEPAMTAGGRGLILEMRDVHKSFDGKVVLNGVDVAVRAGERVALIGPSGSGKTTILRMAIGLTKPDSGTIRIADRYLWHEERNGGLVPAGERHARISRRPVGMVFQHFNLFPHMTALENVREPIVHSLKVAREEADRRGTELLRKVGLHEHRDKLPAQLSGGQQQRVAIARSLGLEPKIMLFDEVTSALDPELVGEVLGVLRELAHATEMAMLIVTHEMNFASDIADRVLMFDAGRIVEEGPPSQVIKNPVEPRTRQFLRAVNDR